MPSTFTRPMDYADVIDVWAEAGMLPTDEAPAAWLDRFDAYTPEENGWIVATHRDEEVTVSVLTHSGVIRSSCRFDVTAAGLTMLTGALRALVDA